MSRPLRPARTKVVGLAELDRALAIEKAAGRTVVFTNGCYDLLHAGHLHLLEQAAALGDVLVVGLNGDRSVRRLKGPRRPYVPFGERAELLAGLEVVDYVIGFDEDTPEALVGRVRPHVLVKGADWEEQAIAGRETVLAEGGLVVRVPLRQGLSTSRLVERVRAGAGVKRKPRLRTAPGGRS